MPHASVPMRLSERLLHAVLFEIGAIVLTVFVFYLFDSAHNTTHTVGLSVIISLIAVVWNIVFNYGFDKIYTGERLARGVYVRLLHMGLFEGGLFVITVPLIAVVLDVTLWQAFIMDAGIVVVIGVYTFIFNWAYDYLRYRILRCRMD